MMSRSNKEKAEELWKVMTGAVIVSVALFWLSWVFFRLFMATEDAFFGTDYLTGLRVLVLAGWTTTFFFLYCLVDAISTARKKDD